MVPIDHDPPRTGRARGSRHGAAKLSDVEVEEIRLLYAGGSWTIRRLAVRYAVSRSQIHRIVVYLSRTDTIVSEWP